MYPTTQEYVKMLLAQEELGKLSKQGLLLVKDRKGNPIYKEGKDSVILKAKSIKFGNFVALKCFTKDQYGLNDRYSKSGNYIKTIDSTYLPKFIFKDKVLHVKTADGKMNGYPLLIMEWKDGMTLNEYLKKDNLSQIALDKLFVEFLKLTIWMLEQGISHGNLEPENIIVSTEGNITLVDLDTLSVQADNIEEKHKDDYIFLNLLLTLRILSLYPYLLEKYNGSDEIIFSKKDLNSLPYSEKVKSMLPCGDPIADKLYGLSLLCFHNKKLSELEIGILKKIPDTPHYLSTEVTDWDKKNSIKVDNAVYSKDRLRLLKYNQPFGLNDKSILFKIRFGTLTICDNAFDQADSTIVEIPLSIQVIGENALSVKSIKNNSINFKLKDGTLYSYNKKRILKGNIGKESTIFNIPKEVVKIDSDAFYDNGAWAYDNPPYFFKVNSENIQYFRYEYAYIIVDSEALKEELLKKGFKEESILVGDVFVDDNEVIYSNDKSKLLCFPKELNLTYYKISDYCSDIVEDAFNYIPDPDDDGYLYIIGNKLKILDLPDNLKSIGRCALQGCDKLSVVRYNKEDEKNVFDLLDNYKDHYQGSLKNRVQLIPNSSYTRNLDSYLIGCIEDKHHVKYTSDGTKLIDIIIGDSGVYQVSEECQIICNSALNNYAFYEIIIPDSVTAIGSFAFFNAEAEDIHIGKGVLSIEKGAFGNCSNLHHIVIPDSVRYMGESVFEGCTSLQYIVIPQSVLEMGLDNMPKQLQNIYVEEGSILIDKIRKRLDLCHKLILYSNTYSLPYEIEETIEKDGVLYSSDGKRLLKIIKNIDSLVIPDGVEIICDEAFNDLKDDEDNYSLAEVILPTSLREIGRNVFSGTIESIISNSSHFVVENNFLLSSDKKTLYYYFGKGCDYYENPSSVDEIWSGAFASRSITKMKLSSIYSMGDNPFIDLLSYDGKENILKLDINYGNIKFLNGCILNPMGWQADREFNLIAYLGVGSLVDLSLIPYLIKIGKNAFFANLMEEIWLPETLQVIDPDAFKWCFELRKIHIPMGTTAKFHLLLPKNLWNLIVESDFSKKTQNQNVEEDEDLPF